MAPKRCLVVYYSRSGTTLKLANVIAGLLDCRLCEIFDTKKRTGILGYLVTLKDAGLRRPARIELPKEDAADYDLVIVGTPVWAFTVSRPIHAYLTGARDRLPDVAFFATASGVGLKRTFRHMAELSGKEPAATLGLSADQALAEPVPPEARDFVKRLRAEG